MRTLLIALALGCACLVCNTRSTPAAAPQHDGQVPSQVLADLGLSGMQYMTDAQGMEIRGKGFRTCNVAAICCKSACEKTVEKQCCQPSCQPSCRPCYNPCYNPCCKPCCSSRVSGLK